MRGKWQHAQVAVLLLVGGVAAAQEWQTVSERDGVTLEKRAVEGSRFYEYRARTHVALAPAEVVARVWNGIPGERAPSIKKRTVLRKSDDELLIYDIIHTPVVSDRDVTVRLRKLVEGNGFAIVFEAANELGPPPAPHLVRLPAVRGAWHIEPDGTGSMVSYLVYSEPGGSLPAFLTRGPQQSSVFAEFEHVLERLR